MAQGIEARRIAYGLARVQAGTVSRSQLINRGLSSNLVDGWLRSGYLFKVLPGTYSVGRPAETQEAIWMAGVLHGGDYAVLGGESAAEAWKIGVAAEQVEIVRPSGLRRSLRGCQPHRHLEFSFRRGSVQPTDISRIGPVPVMDPARTLIDLAARSPERRLRRYFIEAGRQGLLDSSCLSRIEQRSRGFAGRPRLLALHSCWDPSTGKIRSVLEGEFKLLCAERLLPPPLMNQGVSGYEVDAVWEEAKLIVELDGRRFHSDAFALEQDSRKTKALREMGYRVLRFTWNDIIERPEWVATQIRENLGWIYPRLGGVD